MQLDHCSRVSAVVFPGNILHVDCFAFVVPVCITRASVYPLEFSLGCYLP